MSKSINIVPIKMNKINRVKATVRPQNVRKERIEEEEIDYSKGLDSKQTLIKYQNIMENAKSKVSKKVETKTSKVEGIQNLFGGIKEKAHEMYKSTGAKVTGIKDVVASGAKKVADKGKEVGKKAVDLEVKAVKTGIESATKAASTAINFELSLGKGILNLGEGLVDGVQIVSKITETPFLAMADAVNYVGCKVTNQEYKSILKSSWEQTRERVAYKAVDTLYDKIYDTKIGKAIDEASYLKREGTACKIVEGVSTTLGIIAASIFTGGAAAGGAAAGAAGTGVVSAAASSAGIAAGIAGVKGVGEGSEEAFQNKEVSTARGVLYGVANGAYEGLQYYLGAKIGNSMPIKEGTKISAGLAKGLNSLYHIGFDAVDGGTEGGIRPLLKKIYEDKSYNELFQENGGWSAVLTGAAIGGTVSSLIEGIDAIGVNRTLENSEYQENYHYNYRKLNKKEKEVAKEWDSYGSISPEVGKKLEEIFFEDGYVVGIHRTGTANILENGHASLADKIMGKGLKLTGHTLPSLDKKPNLELNITFAKGKKDWDYANFLRNLKSASGYKTVNGVGSAMIIKIPIDLVDQTDVITKKIGEEFFLDPKYVMGYVNADHGNLRNFINNQIKTNDIGNVKINNIYNSIDSTASIENPKQLFVGDKNTVDFVVNTLNKRRATVTDPNVKAMLNHIDNMPQIKISKNDIGLTQCSRSAHEILVGSDVLATQSESDVFHECAHAFHNYVDGGRVPEEFSDVMAKAQARISNTTSSQLIETITSYNDQVSSTYMYFKNEFDNKTKANMYLKNLNSVKNMDVNMLNTFLKENNIHLNPNTKTFIEDVANFKTQQEISLICRGFVKNQHPEVGPAMDIISSVFGTSYIPSSITGEKPIYFRLCHSDSYYKVDAKRYAEQVANYIDLKGNNFTQTIDFLHHALGDEWYQMMEAQMKRIADKLGG